MNKKEGMRQFDPAVTIQQMGGMGRLKAFVNAKNFTTDDNYNLTFQFSGNRKVNRVTIQLNFLDLYEMTFWKIVNHEVKVVSVVEDLYCDQLIETFEEQTGLYLHF